VAHVLMEIFGSAVPAPWRQAHDETLQRLSLYLGELDGLAARLAADGIPLVALKKWRYSPWHLSLSRLLPHGRSGCAGGKTPFSPGP